MMIVKREERGWAGHFICASECLFRRNTLLTYGDIRVVISTVGGYRCKDKIQKIGVDRYFETMAFHANPEDTRYFDADVSRQVDFDNRWSIDMIDADDLANQMHEAVIREIRGKLLNGGIV
jgi:hypothetical protein